MAYGQYNCARGSRDRNVSGSSKIKSLVASTADHEEAEEDGGTGLTVSATPAPATINWRSLMTSTNRSSRRMGRNVTNLKPQRLGAFEEDSSTETMTGSSRPQVSHKSSSPPAGPPTATGGTLTSSRPTTVTSQSTRVPLSPVRIPPASSSTGNLIGNYKPNVQEIMARYSVTSPAPPVARKKEPPTRSTGITASSSITRSPVRVSSLAQHRPGHSRTKLSSPLSSGLKPVRINAAQPPRSPIQPRSPAAVASKHRSQSECARGGSPRPPPVGGGRHHSRDYSAEARYRNTGTAVNVVSRASREQSRRQEPAQQPPTTKVVIQPPKQEHQPVVKQVEVAKAEQVEAQTEPPATTKPATAVPAAAVGLDEASAATSCNRISINAKCYSVVDTIGSGGSAKVYRALDSSNQLVAIKRVDITEASAVEAQGFRNEIKLLQKLKGNPRIVTLYDSEERAEEGGMTRVLYMVMEHGEKDLSRMLKEVIAARISSNPDSYSGGGGVRTALTDAKVKFYWEEMLEAVQVIHREGIVHSDLKPANFLIAGGFVKLIDFGIASSVGDDKTHVTKDNLIGTFNFMSPEAIQNEDDSGEGGISIKINYKSDVWSLGCILYNLIYGKMPFGEIKNPMKKFQAILDPNHKIQFPNSHSHDPQVVDVLKRCLVRDASERASIEELLNHPYLKADAKATSVLTPSGGNKQLAQVMSMLSSLTPNTRQSVVRNFSKQN